MASERWTDLLDPSEEELRRHAPGVDDATIAALAERDGSRPHLRSHDLYVVGVLRVPVLVPADDRVYYQEIGLLADESRVLTVRKTPHSGQPFDPREAIDATTPDDAPAMIVQRLLDEIAERYLDLVDGLDAEIENLEDHVDEWPPDRVRRSIADIRHNFLHIRRTLTPMRDAVREVVDGRVRMRAERPSRQLELGFATVYDKLLRATEGLDFSRDLLSSVRDYLQAKVTTDQNEVMKRLTAIASLLLLPTFIVGLYGQNFKDIPELGWSWGYWWAWGLIVVTTVLQLVYYRRKRWI